MSITNVTELKASACLQNMDIPLWAKKPTRQTGLFLCEPKMCVPVWIMLEKKIHPHSEADKILQGMLKVLALPKEKMALSWCVAEVKPFSEIQNVERTDPNTIAQKIIQYWQPKTCLFLGQAENPTTAIFKTQCFFTYHPDILLETPEYKRSAYQVLLSLKNYLEKGEAQA